MTDRDLTHHGDRPILPVMGPRAVAIAVAVIALVGLAGAAGWLASGDTLFWSMLQAGLAWCL